MPVFSIITVVYNGVSLLRGTMQSVCDQDFKGEIEYILVDGASKDGSQELIAGFAQKMPALRWVSEPDRGLYDAMNKGLSMASGDFVLFLNAGDEIYAHDTLRLVAGLIAADTGVLYGETMLVDDARRPQGLMRDLSTRRPPRALHWKDYLGGMLVVHQSFIARRSLCGPYRLDNLCADFDWCIRILKNSPRNTYTDSVISNYLMGGISKKRHRKSLLDRFEVMRSHYGLFNAVLAHVHIVFRAIAHRFARANAQRY
jgi:glycosyltransferase involved in cell wall biosynthesis